MTSSFITPLVQSYGYYAVFALIALESLGIPLPGETALIAASLYAGTTHHLNVAVLAAVAAAGANAVHLGMNPGNDGARAFYLRLGFHPIPVDRPDTLYLGRSTEPNSSPAPRDAQ